MANVTGSVLTVDTVVQKDGRVWISEAHTDLAAVVHVYGRWGLASDQALNATMTARAVTIGAELQAGEIATNVAAVTALGSIAATTLVFSTAAQNFAALRSAYATATQTQAVMIGDFLSSLTDGQLQTAFGITAGQVTTLRTNKLTPAASLAASIRASAGQ